MCGIAGILQPAHKIVDPACLALMGRTQTHRGPDNFAVFSEANFGCAHNRLSILDLSPAGNQPYADARYVLVYNGEIYNYLELRQKLEGLGERFTSSSDTAVLFAHLARFGVPATLQAIRGMFAFSFYDRQEQTVTLCRDRLGIKPLASIESRFPFLDEELVRFAINLPVQRKIGRTWRLYNPKHPFLVDKAIVRRAAATRLPPALLRKRKSGFPMYGLRSVRTRAGYFQGGYVAGLLRLSPEAEAYMLRAQPPYQVAKLIAVDVFGRLFGMGQSVAQVSEHLKAWVTIASDAPQEQRER